jgi:hypothetical protein
MESSLGFPARFSSINWNVPNLSSVNFAVSHRIMNNKNVRHLIVLYLFFNRALRESRHFLSQTNHFLLACWNGPK